MGYVLAAGCISSSTSLEQQECRYRDEVDFVLNPELMGLDEEETSSSGNRAEGASAESDAVESVSSSAFASSGKTTYGVGAGALDYKMVTSGDAGVAAGSAPAPASAKKEETTTLESDPREAHAGENGFETREGKKALDRAQKELTNAKAKKQKAVDSLEKKVDSHSSDHSENGDPPNQASSEAAADPPNHPSSEAAEPTTSASDHRHNKDKKPKAASEKASASASSTMMIQTGTISAPSGRGDPASSSTVESDSTQSDSIATGLAVDRALDRLEESAESDATLSEADRQTVALNDRYGPSENVEDLRTEKILSGEDPDAVLSSSAEARVNEESTASGSSPFPADDRAGNDPQKVANPTTGAVVSTTAPAQEKGRGTTGGDHSGATASQTSTAAAQKVLEDPFVDANGKAIRPGWTSTSASSSSLLEERTSESSSSRTKFVVADALEQVTGEIVLDALPKMRPRLLCEERIEANLRLVLKKRMNIVLEGALDLIGEGKIEEPEKAITVKRCDNSPPPLPSNQAIALAKKPQKKPRLTKAQRLAKLRGEKVEVQNSAHRTPDVLEDAKRAVLQHEQEIARKLEKRANRKATSQTHLSVRGYPRDPSSTVEGTEKTQNLEQRGVVCIAEYDLSGGGWEKVDDKCGRNAWVTADAWRHSGIVASTDGLGEGCQMLDWFEAMDFCEERHASLVAVSDFRKVRFWRTRIIGFFL